MWNHPVFYNYPLISSIMSLKRFAGSCGGMFLAVQQQAKSRNPSPSSTQVKPADKPQQGVKESQLKSAAPEKKDEKKEDPSPLIAQRKLGVGESPPKVFKKKAPPPMLEGTDEDVRKSVEETKKTFETQRQVPKHACIDSDQKLSQVSFVQERQPSKSEIVRNTEASKQIRGGPKPGDAIPRPHAREASKQSSAEDVPKRPPGQSGPLLTTSCAPTQAATGSALRPTSTSTSIPSSSSSSKPTSTTSANQQASSSHLPSSSNITKPSQPPPVSSQPPSTSSASTSQTKHEMPKIIPKFELSLATNSSNETDGVTSSSSTEKLIGAESPQALRPIKKIEDVNTIKRQPKGGWL